MKLKPLVAALAFAAAGPSLASTCAQPSSTVWDLGPPGSMTFCNSFWTSGSFNDSYMFSIDAPANSSGWTSTWDWSWTTGISLSKVSLTNTSTGAVVYDNTPSSFTFNNLASGIYRLGVQGSVTGWAFSFPGNVGYTGTLQTTALPVVSATPEPATYAMLALGLGMLGWQTRRARKS